VTLGGQPVASVPYDVPYSGSAPGLESGFFQINLTVPSGLESSTVPLSVEIGGVASVPVAISIE
jgi:uncharacterized protein (TIGR03437 family)